MRACWEIGEVAVDMMGCERESARCATPPVGGSVWKCACSDGAEEGEEGEEERAGVGGRSGIARWSALLLLLLLSRVGISDGARSAEVCALWLGSTVRRLKHDCLVSRRETATGCLGRLDGRASAGRALQRRFQGPGGRRGGHVCAGSSVHVHEYSGRRVGSGRLALAG